MYAIRSYYGVMFFTLIPMIIGTTIGNFIIKHGAGTVVNEYGITENIPTESMSYNFV